MNHDLPELLDLLGPRATLKDRATLSQLVSKEDICTFNLKINKTQPASSNLKEKTPQGDILVTGRLEDYRPAYESEHLRDQSGEKIELLIPNKWKWKWKTSKWEKRDVIECSGHLQCWNGATNHYQFRVSKIHGDPIWLWVFKIIFFYPIWIPCWLIYKTVYVAIPVGLILLVVGEWQDNGDLSRWGLVLSFGFGITGLMLRLYVWAIRAKGQAEDIEFGLK